MNLEINYIDAPEGAQDKATAVSENANSLSDDSLIITGARDVPWATLEPGVWRLDGTRKIMPNSPKPGWWSTERSGEDARFTTPPRITITFPVPYAATGFTFTFSPSTEQYCSEIHATWYNGQTLLISKTYYPDSPRWILEETVSSFDTLVIELVATNKPGHFAKIQRIEIGRTVLFGADEIVKARLLNEIDPTLCDLPFDTMTFEMHDPQNRSFLPQENQRVELIQNGTLRAVQYITFSTRKAKSDYTIKCQSSIGLLNDDFLGGMYDEKPVLEILPEILGEWEFELDDKFKDMTITGYIPVCTQREALQRVAFAIGAMVTTQDSAKIRLLPVPAVVSNRFSNKDIFIGGSVKTAPRYAKVEVYSHAYTKNTESEVLMDEEEVSGEDVLITFSNPYYDYEITGGTITGSDVNWITVTADGPVTVSAKGYLHTTRSHVKRNPEATAKERGNVIAVKEATLIHSGNAQEALDRLYTSVQRRQTVNQDVIVSGQKAGQMVSSFTPWGTITRGFLSAMDSTLTQNGHTAAIQIQGVEVTLESVWYYSGEIYSGDTEVVY